MICTNYGVTYVCLLNATMNVFTNMLTPIVYYGIRPNT